ncbi:MAG: S9 family peptidase, partial [Planctomycetes bacterium]|nr:S9 family peptidase [Planctomycetota bacterium]
MRTLRITVLTALVLLVPTPALAAGKARFKPEDVFKLEFASDPQVSPDGKRVVYVRNFLDIMKDRRRSNLWVVNADGTGHQPLTTGSHSDASPRWSPDGGRLAYVSDRDGSPQLYCLWLDTGRRARLTRLPSPPLAPSWSPDGKQLAFASFIRAPVKPFIELPAKPEGADWAAPPKVIRKVHYRFDGRGYLEDGNLHVFVVSAEGGAPRQLTSGPHDHPGSGQFPDALAWTPDGKSLLISANRHADADHEPLDSEVYEVSVVDRGIKALTDRRGPDTSPAVSPDGKWIAYVGFDDRHQGHQVAKLYLMDRHGRTRRLLTDKFDRSVKTLAWAPDGKGVSVLYEDQGDTKVGLVSLDGAVKPVAVGVGGTTLDRPYSSGSFSAGGGAVAFTLASPSHPADVAVVTPASSKPRRLTDLNAGLLGDRALADVEEIWFKSSRDGRKIHGWIAKPPDFDPKKKYPLILEIHGGPFASYGPRFAVDVQLYAAAG